MVILSPKHPGIFFMCEQCSALVGDVRDNEIYEDNAVYCPVCHYKNLIPYYKKYDGVIKNPNFLEENTKES